jgi:outer membrane murein-binding lipoprotein Lpp
MDLFKEAEEKIAKTRVDELRADINQLDNDLQALRSTPVELEDEP